MNSDKPENRLLSTWDQLEKSRPLPVRFKLFASRRTNKALCPCLVVHHHNISVIRILDPEHRQPYISLDSIFLLSGRTIPAGILEFELSREAGDYDLTLAGLEPREGLWVPLKLARQVAGQLGLLNLLSVLLDWENRHIWSLDEGEAGLIHNWRALQLDADSYSTGLLVQTDLNSLTLLSRGQQVRTLLSHEQRQGALNRLSTMINTSSQQLDQDRNKYEQRLLRWSVLACEELMRSRKALLSSDDREEEDTEFSFGSSDLLLLFNDYLKSMDIDTTFASVSIDSEEISSGQKGDDIFLNPSKDEIYRRARVHVILIHHIWSLTMSQIRLEKDSAPSTTSSKAQQSTLIPEETQLKEQLKRIENSSKRSEWALSELLLRKSMLSTSTLAPPQQQQQIIWKVPFLARLDSRLLVAVLFGILLGSLTSRM